MPTASSGWLHLFHVHAVLGISIGRVRWCGCCVCFDYEATNVIVEGEGEFERHKGFGIRGQ